jgi:hypothetical protein
MLFFSVALVGEQQIVVKTQPEPKQNKSDTQLTDGGFIPCHQ